MTDRISGFVSGFSSNVNVDDAVGAMSESLKKLGATSSKYLGRAVQLTEERLGQAPKTELEELTEYRERARILKEQTEQLSKELNTFLDPNPGLRLDKFVPSGPKAGVDRSNYHRLGGALRTASAAHGMATPFGRGLGLLADAEEDIGSEFLSFSTQATDSVTRPMAAVENKLAELSTEERELSLLRLDLDAAKARARKASTADKTIAADSEVRQVQYDFDRQYDKVEQLLAHLAEAPVEQNQLLHVFAEQQLEFHRKSVAILEKLMQSLPTRLDVETNIRDTLGSKPAAKAPPRPAAPPLATSSVDAALDPFAGAKFPVKAKALLNFTAANPTELSLKAGDEVTVEDRIDEEWVLCEKNGRTGKVLVSHLISQ